MEPSLKNWDALTGYQKAEMAAVVSAAVAAARLRVFGTDVDSEGHRKKMSPPDAERLATYHDGQVQIRATNLLEEMSL